MPNSLDQDPNHQDPDRLDGLRKSVEQSVENIKLKTHQALRPAVASPTPLPMDFPVRWIQELYSQVDLLAQTAQQSAGVFACGEGCSSCCHARVEVTPPEVFSIYNYLSEEPDDRRPQLTALLNSRLGPRRDDQADSLVESRWSQRPPCALLVDRRCSVYPVRPAACRKGHSYDAQACKDGQSELPLHYGFVLGSEVWMAGVSKGYEAAGLQSTTLELSDALLKVLENPQMQADWLEGRSVF